jgi:molybdopterin-guanine dinucleotide biosynthesis protein A
VLIDGVVLTGGKSSRLSGTPKSGLLLHGRTLLEHSLDALSLCRHIVVVGTVPQGVELPRRIQQTRETPLFGGPAAGVAAGVAALASIVHHHSDVTVVLACDMPGVSNAVPLLLAALAELAGGDGVIAVDSTGTPQPLIAAYRTDSLRRAIAAQPTVDGLAMHTLLTSLDLTPVSVPDRFVDDIDTWADAARFGISPQPPESGLTAADGTVPVVAVPAAPGSGASAAAAPASDAPATPDRASTDAALAIWSEQLARELGLSEVEISIDSILGLAGKVAHTVVRPAAPLTTFLVGFAAGRASAGAMDATEAISAASAAALRLTGEYKRASSETPDASPVPPRE